MPPIETNAGFPLRFGRTEEFVCVREFFKSAGFDEATLCRLLDLEGMGEIARARWEDFVLDSAGTPAFRISSSGGPKLGDAKTSDKGLRVIKEKPAPRLLWCIEAFMRGLRMDPAEARVQCGPDVFAALISLGLLRPCRKSAGQIVCPVWVYPADGFLVASDRVDDPEGDPYSPPEDIVFPAIYGGTLRFLSLLPDLPGGDCLDHCGGCGIGALHSARTARSAATADLTQRSASYAEFNARLNGVAIESLCGDLYDPVQDRSFDLITAHPPFVPSTGANMIYRDGGETGEEITRRIVEGLPKHLRPGGRCLILCVARDTMDKSFEQRAYEWLGEARGEFEILFGHEQSLTIGEVVESVSKRNASIGRAESEALMSRLQSFGTRRFVYGALYVRRCASRVQEAPSRVRLGMAGRAADFERLLAWRERCRQPGFLAWLVESRPRLSPKLELSGRHVVVEGRLEPVEFVFTVTAGFEAALRLDLWVVPVLVRLQGVSSVREIFEHARASEELPPNFTLEDFARLVRRMIDSGFFVVDPPVQSVE